MPVDRSENIATYESNREFERRMKRRERQKAKVTPKEQAERYHDAHLAHEEREQPAAVAKRQKAVVRRASAEKQRIRAELERRLEKAGIRIPGAETIPSSPSTCGSRSAS